MMSRPPHSFFGMQHTREVIVCLLASILFFLSIPSLFPLHAQDTQEITVSIGPPIFDYEVIRGEVIKDAIVIVNRSEAPLPFRIIVRNWTAKGESGDIEFVDDPALALPFNPREWITLETANILLAPGEKKEIPFTIRVPEDAEPGGHYAMIHFESLLAESRVRSEGPVILPQIGSLIFFTVHVPEAAFIKDSLVLAEFFIPLGEMTRPLAFLEPIPIVRAASHIAFIDERLNMLTLKISNADIIHHRPEGEIQIINSLGRVVARYDLPGTTILPGKSRLISLDLRELEDRGAIRGASKNTEEKNRFAAAVANQLVIGRYKALVRLGEGDQVLGAELSVWAFPWRLIAVLLFVIFLFGFFVIQWRKRISLALHALFGNNATSK